MTISVAFTHCIHTTNALPLTAIFYKNQQGLLYLPSERRLTYQIPSHVTSLSPINF